MRRLPRVQTGLSVLTHSPPGWLHGRRLGLLCNAASVDHQFHHAKELIRRRFPGQLRALFSPQHGFLAEKQDNMVESDHGVDPDLGIPVFSLYGETRIPTPEMFEEMDVLIVDLQDAGTRVYTFIYTLSHCMEAARSLGKRVIVLDRPNPVNGVDVEGNLLREPCASFVGRYPIPMRHGLTIGELARLFNDRFGIGCPLTVIPMEGWDREMFFPETGLPWVPPSPNLPTLGSVVVYPGQVLWEGTNVSEGRGTTLPFEIFGAPFIRHGEVLDRLGGRGLPGAVLRPAGFQPVANKWEGRLCTGFQIHVTDPRRYRPYLATLRFLWAVRGLYPEAFQWKPPPYEYEYTRTPIDLITGDAEVRQSIDRGEDPLEKAALWRNECEAFEETAEPFRLYP